MKLSSLKRLRGYKNVLMMLDVTLRKVSRRKVGDVWVGYWGMMIRYVVTIVGVRMSWRLGSKADYGDQEDAQVV
jgi:uncharacterized membrane protein